MTEELNFAQQLIDFIYESPTAFHAVSTVKDILSNCGFREVKEADPWNLEQGGKFFVTKNDSAIAAFVLGTGNIEECGFKIVGAHTDSPSFRIKPAPEIASEGSYVKLNTEVYGGPILNTWLDRPLAVAGRITVRSEDILYPETRLVNIRKPILIIPNLAIHMNREINKGVELNAQKDLLPLMAQVNESLEKGDYLLNAIAEELKLAVDSIIDFDLFLYEYEKGTIIGLNNEFISSGRLDDLAMVHAGIAALTRVEAVAATNVMIAFDNEEVGSGTKQGGDSQFFSNVLERIVLSQGKGREDFFRALAKSFMLSADLAHAVHPNLGDKHDPVLRPFLNKGPVIKISANQSYTTDSNSDAVYEEICKKASVPVQKFVNRSDLKGGSTIGPISATHLDIRSIDIGNPILAMHSVRELAGVLDHTFITSSFEEFYKL
ncbi:MAG: family aminopeptidase 2 [Firmicutes bacterium]|nr:family aminopeptidase 2 [Bacillota bacterium]